MEEIKKILNTINRGGDSESFLAAQVLNNTNQELNKLLNINPTEARAVSFKQGIIIIEVSHGAIAEKIAMNQQLVCEAVNKKNKTTGATQTRVNKIITRQI